MPAKAQKLGIDPLEVALSVYLAPDNPKKGIFTNFPHYVLDWAGHILQVADELERARHVALGADRALYASGAWRRKVSPKCLALWDARWGKKSPLGLFPSKAPNEDYVGIECIPLLAPQADGSLFTDAQYRSLAALLWDIAQRHGFSLDDRSRLVGHEDLEPLGRWYPAKSRRPYGWDPGGLQPFPAAFDWRRVVPTARVALVGCGSGGGIP